MLRRLHLCSGSQRCRRAWWASTAAVCAWQRRLRTDEGGQGSMPDMAVAHSAAGRGGLGWMARGSCSCCSNCRQHEQCRQCTVCRQRRLDGCVVEHSEVRSARSLPSRLPAMIRTIHHPAAHSLSLSLSLLRLHMPRRFPHSIDIWTRACIERKEKATIVMRTSKRSISLNAPHTRAAGTLPPVATCSILPPQRLSTTGVQHEP